MVQIYGFSDSGSYLQAALSLIEHGQNIPEWQWVLNLWPPGMVWLDAAIIVISPQGFGVILGFVTSAVWATTFSVIAWPLMRTKGAVAFVLLTELLVLATSPFQSWMLDEGLLYADGFASATFLLGLALIVNRVWAGGGLPLWVRDGIFAGISFAVAVYFRASYNLVPWVMVVLALLVALLALIRRKRGRDHRELVPQFALLAVAAVTMGALMLPYTAHLVHDRGRVQFVQTEDLIYQQVWEDPKIETIPQWMKDGGSTVGCDIDPQTCKAIHAEEKAGVTPTPAYLRDRLILAIVEHPAEFVMDRVAVVVPQWFGDEIASYSRVDQDYAKGSVSYSGSHNYNPPQGFVYLFLLLGACVAASALAFRRGQWALLLVPLSALALLAPFSIVHVEVRYLIPLKLIALLAPTLVMLWKRDRNRGSASTNSLETQRGQAETDES